MLKHSLQQSSMLLVIVCLSINSTLTQEPSKVSSLLLATTSTLFSSGDASDTTTKYAHTLVNQLDKEQTPPQVKKMNKILEYVLGYKNTMVLPGVNQVYINEDWINKLSEEQKRFVIGRAIVWLKNWKKYLAIQGGLACAILALECKTLHIQEQPAKHPINNLQTLWTPANSAILKAYALQFFLFAITTCSNRSLVYSTDTITVEKLNCAEGAITALDNLAHYEHDNTFLGTSFASFPVTSCALLLAINTRFYKISKIVDSFIGNIPGRIHNTPNVLGFRCTNLPLAHYFSRHPSISKRTTSLEKYKTT